jgi:integrase
VAEQERERVLADWELRVIWTAAGKVTAPYGDFVKLLALTAQRRDEVAAISRRAELHDLDAPSKAIWLLPAERTKAGREHMVPLSRAAIDIIAGIPAPADDRPKGDFLLSTTNGVRPISGYSKFKAELDEMVAEQLAELNAGRASEGAEPLKLGDYFDDRGVKRSRGERWTLHDLRRTASTAMQRLGVADAVRKVVLNHSRKADLGVTAVYSHHDYADEKRVALDRWATHLLGIVEPPKTDNVAPITAAHARRRAGAAQ